MPNISSSASNIFRIAGVNGHQPASKNIINRFFAAIKSVLNTSSRIESKLIRQINQDSTYSGIATIASVTSINERLRMIGTVMTEVYNNPLDDELLPKYTERSMALICALNPQKKESLMKNYKKLGREFIKKGNAGKPIDKQTYAEALRCYYDMQFIDKFPEPPSSPEASTSRV